jgi:hypothetical protein
VTGDCCDNGQRSTCDGGQICCGNTCVAGECCQAADCPVQTCQRRTCQDHQCGYAPVTGAPGPRCQSICCEDEQGAPVCCAAGTRTCAGSGSCGCAAWSNQTTFGSHGAGVSQFNFPSGVAVSPDMLTVWVADTNNTRMSVWTRPSTSSASWSNPTTFGSFGAGLSQFKNPYRVAVAPDGRTVWVADAFNHRISVWELACPA